MLTVYALHIDERHGFTEITIHPTHAAAEAAVRAQFDEEMINDAREHTDRGDELKGKTDDEIRAEFDADWDFFYELMQDARQYCTIEAIELPDVDALLRACLPYLDGQTRPDAGRAALIRSIRETIDPTDPTPPPAGASQKGGRDAARN